MQRMIQNSILRRPFQGRLLVLLCWLALSGNGPLLADDEETMIGSCFLVEADSMDAVMKFHENDPFHAAGLWEKVSIRPFLKRMDNRA